MNKYIKSVAAVLSLGLLFACQQEEIVKSPEFTVTDASGNIVLSYTEGNQYNIDLTAFQYAVSANKNNEIAAAEIFNVASNMSWRLVAAEEGQDWIRPFPEEGDKEGRFLFLAERNNDQTKGRTAYYNIYVDDGAGEKPVPGMIIINQAANVDFLKVSVAKVDINNSDTGKKNIAVISNLDWTYEIVPDDSYGTENIEWLKDLTVHPASQQCDTVTVKAANNANGMIRGALVKIICDSKPEFSKTIPILQFGKDVDISGFPIGWTVGAGSIEASNFKATWPAEGYGEATTGTGRFMYVEAEGKLDPDKKFARTVGATGDPYVTGAWPGDYWAFVSDTPVSSGTILKIAFESRVSATGHKFWRLEYLDGEEWKIAGKALTTDEPGQEIVYTHAMNSDGSTNIQVSTSVKYENTTPGVEFRFVCAANWQASGKGALSKPNGGTARLSVSKTDGIQPTISCVAAGTEDMTPANVAISGLEDGNIMTFEGTPSASKTFTVTSDKDFTVKPTVSWLAVENGSGAADETKVVVVTCAPSVLSNIRKGVIEVKSGVTKINIPVIQSAAGGELDPVIGLVGGNYVTVLGEGDDFSVRVQSNVGYKIEMPEWIEEVSGPESKALVEVGEHFFKAAANMTGAGREGKVRFYNEASKIETILNVSQENFEPRITVTSQAKTYPGISGLGGVIKFNIDANIPFTVSADASWIKLPVSQGVAGVFDVPVTFEANTSDEARSAKVTFANETYGYTYVLDVSQYAHEVLFADDFSWLKPLVNALNPDGSKNYDTVGSGDYAKAEAPNIYTTAELKEAFLSCANAIGWYIPGKAEGSNNVLYLQDCYIKLGKSGADSQTSVTLPQIDPAGKPMTISFDCARMVGPTTGKLDDFTVTCVIEGNGTFENGTKYSDEITTPQTGDQMFWTNISLKVLGADKDTKITLAATAIINKEKGTFDYTTKKTARVFYDNFVVKAN